MIKNQHTPEQEILISTKHFQDSVVEIYLNQKKNLITELIHLSNHRVNVYQYDADKYLKESRKLSGINQKINSLTELNHID